MSKSTTEIKLTVVGDDGVGKTFMIMSLTNTTWEDKDYIPLVIDNTLTPMVVDNINTNLYIWDTAGSDDYSRLRPLSYPNTNVFLLVFSLDNPSSLERIRTVFYPEVVDYCPGVPIVLVGTKMDLRTPGNPNCISSEHGVRLKEDIGAVKYLECSSISKIGLNNVFEEAIRVARMNMVITVT